MKQILIFESTIEDEGKWTDKDVVVAPPGLHHSKLFVSCRPSSIAVVSEPWNEEDYGWEFLAKADGIVVSVLIQPGDRDNGWMLQILPVSLFFILRRTKVRLAIASVSSAIEGFLRHDSRFTNVQRFSAAEYDALVSRLRRTW